MRYNPNDMPETPVIKEGRYPFRVKRAEEKTSKAGNEMVEIVLSVTVSPTRNIEVFDYLVSTPKALFKIEQFCRSVGLLFANGSLEASQIEGLEGEAIFVNELSDNGKKYLRVNNYLPSEIPGTINIPNDTGTAEQPIPEDEIPF